MEKLLAILFSFTILTQALAANSPTYELKDPDEGTTLAQELITQEESHKEFKDLVQNTIELMEPLEQSESHEISSASPNTETN